VHCVAMKVKAKNKPALAVRCHICGAKPGEKCELATGQERTAPHLERLMSQIQRAANQK